MPQQLNFLFLETGPELITHLSLTQEAKPKHVIVFQHIPLYLKTPDEEDDYFNLQRGVRQNLIDRFKKAGRTALLTNQLFSLVIAQTNLHD